MVAADVGYTLPGTAREPQRHTITAHSVRYNRYGRYGGNLQSMSLEMEAAL